MNDLGKTWFDTKAFTEQLTLAIEAALERSLNLFDHETVRCLALDIHPDPGFLNLCMRVEGDESNWHADWKHACFAAAYGVANWPEGLALAQSMEQMTLKYLQETEDYDGFEEPFLICAVHAFSDERINASMAKLKRSADFEYFVGKPQDPQSENYCRTHGKGDA